MSKTRVKLKLLSLYIILLLQFVSDFHSNGINVVTDFCITCLICWIIYPLQSCAYSYSLFFSLLCAHTLEVQYITTKVSELTHFCQELCTYLYYTNFFYLLLHNWRNSFWAVKNYLFHSGSFSHNIHVLHTIMIQCCNLNIITCYEYMCIN